MYKIGLKLWSINTDYYYDEAIRLYNDGVFDYIELYVVPDSLDTIKKWKTMNIPFIIHAPHFAHNVNLADINKFEYNKQIYNQVEEFRIGLNAEYTIVHSGIEGNVDEVVRQLGIIQPKNILIENKPYRAPLGEKKLCRGYSIEEVLKIIKEIGCGFCLDIGHAICSANSLGEEPYTYLENFNKLNPVMYHISGNYIDSSVDKHLHLNQGSYDYQKIFNIIKDGKYISIETNKDSKLNLNDFMKDVLWLKQISNI